MLAMLAAMLGIKECLATRLGGNTTLSPAEAEEDTRFFSTTKRALLSGGAEGRLD